MKEKRKLLMELFTSTLYLSAFTFGGGYVIVSLLKERFVDQLHYIDEKEMLDLVATHKAYLVNMTGLSYRLKETQKMRQDK